MKERPQTIARLVSRKVTDTHIGRQKSVLINYLVCMLLFIKLSLTLVYI